MNVEAFSTKKRTRFRLKVYALPRRIARCRRIYDYQDPYSQKRTKAITTMAPMARYRRILTGSPVTKSPLDLFSQCRFLNEHLLGFGSYYALDRDMHTWSVETLVVDKYRS